jgi:putative redox protein
MAVIEARVSWDGDMHFTGIGSRNRFPIPMDEAAEGGRAGVGASPMELVLIGLGGCTGMDVASILSKMRQHVTSYEVRVRGERAADHPRLYTSIVVEHVLTGRGLDPAKVERAVRLSETKYCSVSATLAKGVTLRHDVTIIEEPAGPARA